ncbi:MAG: glutamate racemase [Oscillospiraceae bacterium]
MAKACPLFVPLVENGRFRRGDPVIETVAREYLEPLRQEGLDTLILGCTHYPLLTDIIGDIMGPGVTLINASEEGRLGASARPCGTHGPALPRSRRPVRPPSTPATSSLGFSHRGPAVFAGGTAQARLARGHRPLLRRPLWKETLKFALPAAACSAAWRM